MFYAPVIQVGRNRVLSGKGEEGPGGMMMGRTRNERRDDDDDDDDDVFGRYRLSGDDVFRDDDDDE
jgi:hypothetical protein